MNFLRLIKIILLENKGKCIMISLCIILYPLINLEDSKNKIFVISKFEVISDKNMKVKKIFFIYKKNDKSDNYGIVEFDDSIKLENGNIIQTSMNPISVISITTIIILLLITIIMALVSDDDVGWRVTHCRITNLIYDVKCDEEDNIWIYHINGKLLERRSAVIDNYSLRRLIRTFLLDKNLFPDFNGTKQQIRNSGINDILEIKQ